MISIFQSEVTALESQVAALQAQIAQAQQRITALGECELETDGAIQALTSAVQKVSALAPDALATLKATVFNLFNSDGDGGHGGNDEPQPEPPQPDQMVLDGKSIEIACCLEDCPESSLQGQAVEVSCWYPGEIKPLELTHEGDGYQEWSSVAAPQVIAEPVAQEPVAEKNLFKLIPVSANVAYMSRGDDGEIISVYAGGNNKGKLRNWGDWLTRTHSVTQGYELREGKRLGTKWELKLTSMTLKQIERLAACDFNKDPRSCYPDAPKRQPAKVPSALEIENIGVGDVVRSITVKNWTYKVVKINSDGLYECDRVGANPPISQVLHPGSVELVAKADVVDVAAQELATYLEQQAQAIAPVIDPTDVPRGVILRQTSDDFIVEFNVFAWIIVRNQGVLEPQQRQIGRLVEGLGKIESYRPKAGIYHAFTRTMDAVNYLISGSGYSQANIDAGIQLYESRQQQRNLVGVGASAQQLEDADF